MTKLARTHTVIVAKAEPVIVDQARLTEVLRKFPQEKVKQFHKEILLAIRLAAQAEPTILKDQARLIERLKKFPPDKLKQFHKEILVAIRRAGVRSVKRSEPTSH